MRILLVAPFSKDTVLGIIGNYCLSALIQLGQEVEVFDFRASQYSKNPLEVIFKKAVKKVCNVPRQRLPIICSFEQERMNKSLLAKVEEFSPDIMLVLMGDTILPQTLNKIKKRGVILANWFHDTVLDPGRKEFVQTIPPYYDYFFVYDSAEVLQHIKIGAGCIRSISLACNPEIHRTITLTENDKRRYGSEICFVGSMKYKREELLKSLTDFDLAIWGNWEKKCPQLSKCYRKKNVYDKEAVKIYNASDIALDMHIFYGSKQEAFDINPRVYESTACGTFTITNENPYLNELYDIDKEIVCYGDAEELKEKIRFYLSHPEERSAIAKRGQERSHREHTYEKRLKKIISIIQRKKISYAK